MRCEEHEGSTYFNVSYEFMDDLQAVVWSEAVPLYETNQSVLLSVFACLRFGRIWLQRILFERLRDVILLLTWHLHPLDVGLPKLQH